MKIFTWILLIILLLIAAALAFDAVPFALNIILRKNMGSLKNAEWFTSAQNVCEKWLKKGLPTVPIASGRRLVIIDIIKGTYKSKSISAWQEASVLLASDDIDCDAVLGFINKKINPVTGKWTKPVSSVDEAYLAYAVLSSQYSHKEHIKPAMDEAANMLLKKYREHSGIPYRGDTNIRFVDTTAMACPFLLRYGVTYKNDEAIKAGINVLAQYLKDGLHPEFGLPVHCYNSETNEPLGIYSWGRGSGWLASALTDCYITLDSTPSTSYIKEKTLIIKAMLDFAERIIAYQRNDGAFDRNLFAFSGADSSATAMIAYFLSYVGNLTQNENYLSTAERALGFIFTVTRRDGTVDYSQADTMGIGFYSMESVLVPATQGFAVRAYRNLVSGGKNDD